MICHPQGNYYKHTRISFHCYYAWNILPYPTYPAMALYFKTSQQLLLTCRFKTIRINSDGITT